ncbi:MAG: dephospho-CoA kinase [Chlorobiaceae bacterium]|jgi:dephospho-CoA kinase|nr:dephospho-CoA kinase [Chlorobiaceae bacterium]NTV17477.1 dephospho-CoA kinase [Chlorobiaceae bacterium]
MMRTYPYLVGITGGLGSGKSMVCSFLSEMGCALFESDRVAKELQLHDPEVIDGIRVLFGAGVYSLDASGDMVLDRKKIASDVFSSSEKLEALNRLIHPKVFGEFRKAVLDARKRETKILVKEAAILFESGGNEGLDAVVVVAAEMPDRIERAVQKGMGTRDEIIRRMAAQWPQEKLIAKADYVLFNKGSLNELKTETASLYRTLLAAAESACNHL